MENLSKKVSELDERAIRIRVPARVAFDLKQMNKVTTMVLKELGCPGCHSGFDLRFDYEKQFLFNEKLDMINRF